MKFVLLIVGVIIALLVLYFLIVGLAPGISVPRQSLKRPLVPLEPAGEPLRKEVGFVVHGARVHAWLYWPEKASLPVPCIVMGHGLGGTKECGLAKYAARFREAGFAVLVFDYRYFGESGGEPRQLVRVSDQLEDWAAAVAYARGLKDVDQRKVALWGSSLGGGHVIVTAARDHQIACAAAQCPGLDGEASALATFKRIGLGKTLRFVVHGQRDMVRSWLGLSPHLVPLVGPAGSVACIADSDAFELFGLIVPPGFINEVCARILIRGDKYQPVKYASTVRCPVLLQICDRDNLTPPSAVAETVAKLGEHVEVKRYDAGHFDIYLGENFEKSVVDQVNFFRKHL
ncbi:MAG: alpha/beta hydrolase [Pseudomonadota bacterium]